MPKGTLKPIARFAERKRGSQWEKLKVFLRTGRKPSGLTQATIAEFSRLGMNHKEAMNRRGAKPYGTVFSPEERKEIRRQALAVVGLLMPGLSKEARQKKAAELTAKAALIRRGHVEAEIIEGDHGMVFDRGRMYLNARGNNERMAAKRNLREALTKGYSDAEIVLGSGWMKTKYTKTTPFHEMAHELGFPDSVVYLAEYYYSLKRGIMNEQYLKRKRINDTKSRPTREKAIKKAAELARTGKQKGWKHADQLLRKELGV